MARRDRKAELKICISGIYIYLSVQKGILFKSRVNNPVRNIPAKLSSS